MYVEIAVAPSTGTSWTFSVMVNGTASSLSCSVLAGNLTSNDTIDSLSINSGDSLSIRALTSATSPVTTGTTKISFLVSSATTTSLIMSGNANNVATNSTIYLQVQGDGVVNATETNTESTIPTPGTISNLYVALNGTTGTGTYVVTLMKNGSTTLLVATVLAGASTANNTINSISVVAGDVVSWQIVTSATATGRVLKISAQFSPTTDGESLSMNCGAGSINQNTTRFNFPIGGSAWNVSIEAQRQSLLQACTIKKMYVTTISGTAVVSSKTGTFTASRNSVLQSLSTSVIGDGSSLTLQANDTTDSFTVVDGDSLSIKGVTNATVNAISPQVSMVFFISPGTASTTSLGILTTRAWWGDL